MSPIPDYATIVRRADVVSNDLSDTDTVMLDIDGGMYYGVQDAGKMIWAELERPVTLSALRVTLAEHFDVDAETCRRDVAAFIDQLRERNLIDVDTSSPRA